MKERIGPVTPNKVASLALLFAGLAAFACARFIKAWDGEYWAGIGLLLLAASFLVDALLPGGSKPTDEQVAMVRRAGIPYRDGAEKIMGLALGGAFLAGGIYLVS